MCLRTASCYRLASLDTRQIIGVPDVFISHSCVERDSLIMFKCECAHCDHAAWLRCVEIQSSTLCRWRTAERMAKWTLMHHLSIPIQRNNRKNKSNATIGSGGTSPRLKGGGSGVKKLSRVCDSSKIVPNCAPKDSIQSRFQYVIRKSPM